MAVSQERLNRYRKDLDAIGDAAYSFVDEFVRATMANNPGMSVAELRNEAIDAIDSSLYGDQASELALDLFEEIVVDGYGLDADTVIEDVIDSDMIEGGVRYSARQLVEGDTEAFTRDVADLTRYYIKRSAMETMPSQRPSLRPRSERSRDVCVLLHAQLARVRVPKRGDGRKRPCVSSELRLRDSAGLRRFASLRASEGL